MPSHLLTAFLCAAEAPAAEPRRSSMTDGVWKCPDNVWLWMMGSRPSLWDGRAVLSVERSSQKTQKEKKHVFAVCSHSDGWRNKPEKHFCFTKMTRNVFILLQKPQQTRIINHRLHFFKELLLNFTWLFFVVVNKITHTKMCTHTTKHNIFTILPIWLHCSGSICLRKVINGNSALLFYNRLYMCAQFWLEGVEDTQSW